MELDNKYKEISGEELKKVLKSLDEIRDNISSFKWDKLPLNIALVGKGLHIEFSVIRYNE